MPSKDTDAEILATIELVVRRYCDLFHVTDLEERADIITRVLVMFERGTTDEVDLMANLLATDKADENSPRQKT